VPTFSAQVLGGFAIFELIVFNEEVKCLLCVLSGCCHLDIMDILLFFGLTVFGELVEYVCRLLNPATLTAGLAEDFSDCFLKKSVNTSAFHSGFSREITLALLMVVPPLLYCFFRGK
jgi:hypothetical protein